MQHPHYPILLVIVYKASTGLRFIRSEEIYFEFVRHLHPDVIAFFETGLFQKI